MNGIIYDNRLIYIDIKKAQFNMKFIAFGFRIDQSQIMFQNGN